jgi:hypothetical protein
MCFIHSKKLLTILIKFSAIDAGGIFRSVAQSFFDEIKTFIFEKLGATKIIDNENGYYFLNNDIILYVNNYYYIFGKILFWTLLHNGSWPHYLHQYLFKILFGEDINYIDVANSLSPSLKNLISKLGKKNDNEDDKDLELWCERISIQVTNLIVACDMTNPTNLSLQCYYLFHRAKQSTI